jgi:hypothetical protein
MSLRLPIDANLIAYYGFDEANETDPALDEGLNNVPLTVLASTGVRAARIGNGRQFDGVNTVARPTGVSDPFYFFAFGTLICWITLDAVNSGGDLLRPIVALDGPTGALADNTIFYLGVDNQGRLVYRYDQNLAEPIIFKTAAGTIRIGRYYSIALQQNFTALNLSVVTLYIDNVATPWASLTVNGVVQADPNAPTAPPTRAAIPTATFTVGGSMKSPSLWQGVIDELSIHKVVRPYNAYLQAAYYRLTQALSFTKLTGVGTIRTIGAVEMGGGNRWWAYERDQSIFIIRENSLGLFSSEIQLTTGGNLPSGAPMPGGNEQPRLAYDQATDTLLVVFLAAGRVYKLTAASSDAAVTQNMPYTQDTAGIIKVRDTLDLFRGGPGQAPTSTSNEPGQRTVSDSAAVPFVRFLFTPSFGLAIEGLNPYGYAIYTYVGGVETLLGTVTLPQTARWETYQGYHFFPIASRAFATTYFVRPLLANGRVSRVMSNLVTDYLAQWVTDFMNGQPDDWVYGRDDFPHDHFAPTPGEAARREWQEEWVLVTRTPIKIPIADTFVDGTGEPAARLWQAEWAFVSRTPIKQPLSDFVTLGLGASTRVTMLKTGGAKIDM